MNPDLDFESYVDYIPHLYEICAELGYFSAKGRFKTNDFEIKRVKRAIDLYCQDEDISFETYVKQLIEEYKQKRADRKKELGGRMFSTKQMMEYIEKLEVILPSSYSPAPDYPNDPKNDEGYDLSPHPLESDLLNWDDENPGEADHSNWDDDWDGPKY